MIHLDITKRHDILFLLECVNGNPNGDPDDDGQPRRDKETAHGMITSNCIKRFVRDYAAIAHDQPIFIQNDMALNTKRDKVLEGAGVVSEKGKKKSGAERADIASLMCQSYYDIRSFGAVITFVGSNAAQIMGPLQVVDATTVHPVEVIELSITRKAVTRQEDIDSGKKTDGDMGKRSIVPYGLYRGYAFFNPALAAKTGVTEDDLGLFYDGLVNSFEVIKSASRGLMTMRKVYVFTHSKKWGNARAQDLFSTIRIHTDSSHPRAFEDFTIEQATLPEGITLTIL